MSVTVKKTVTKFILLMVLIAITLLIFITIRPVSLPFVSNYIKNQLENRFHAYYVDFNDIQTHWHPLQGKLDFHLHSVRAVDYGNNILATVPKVIIEVATNSIFKKNKDLRAVELQTPKISLIRTDGGALKFDLGSSNDGSSGRVLETILIYVATAPSTQSSDNQSSIDFRIINSDLTLGDEITGSLLHAPDANIKLKPTQNGVACDYEFNILTRGENLHISGNCEYHTGGENFNLSVDLHEVRPALITTFSPQFTYFSPLEVELSGNIQLELYNLSSVEKASFNLKSTKGTLEIVEILGKNLEVNSLHIVGKALNNYSHIELDQLVIDLENNFLQANALFLRDKDNLDININAFVKGSSISDLLPRWFAYLETDELGCIENAENNFHHSSLSINGIFDLNQQKINAQGHFKCHDVLLSDNEKNYTLDDYLNTAINTDLNFSVDGALDSPNLATKQ